MILMRQFALICSGISVAGGQSVVIALTTSGCAGLKFDLQGVPDSSGSELVYRTWPYSLGFNDEHSGVG